MNFFFIDSCITNCIGNLSGFHVFNAFQHLFCILFNGLFRHIINHCSNALRDGLRWDYNNISVFCQISCLICCKNNVLIIREDKNILCIHFLDCLQNIFCTWIHGLSAFDQIIHTKITENTAHTFAYRHRNKSYLFLRLLFFLHSCHFFRFFNDFFMMFQTHVVNLHSGKLSKSKRFLNCKARIVGMYMYLNDLIICNNDDRITDGFEITLVLLLLCLSQWFI